MNLIIVVAKSLLLRYMDSHLGDIQRVGTIEKLTLYANNRDKTSNVVRVELSVTVNKVQFNKMKLMNHQFYVYTLCEGQQKYFNRFLRNYHPVCDLSIEDLEQQLERSLI